MKASLLGGEDVLDARAHLGACGVAAADVGRHRLAAKLGALELGRQAAAVEEPQIGLGAVGGIGPDTARQIALSRTWPS